MNAETQVKKKMCRGIKFLVFTAITYYKCYIVYIMDVYINVYIINVGPLFI